MVIQSAICIADVRKDLMNIYKFPGQHARCKEAISTHVVAGALTAKTGCHGSTRSEMAKTGSHRID